MFFFSYVSTLVLASVEVKSMPKPFGGVSELLGLLVKPIKVNASTQSVLTQPSHSRVS